LDRYLDRQEKERVGYEEGEEKCNVCRGGKREEEDKEEDEEEDKEIGEGEGEGSEDSSSSYSEEETNIVKAEREEVQ
jgi:hypothetical protein